MNTREVRGTKTNLIKSNMVTTQKNSNEMENAKIKGLFTRKKCFKSHSADGRSDKDWLDYAVIDHFIWDRSVVINQNKVDPTPVET